MKIFNKLVTNTINDKDYNLINNSIKKFYNINNDISLFNPYLNLFTNYPDSYSTFNNKNKIIKLIKKKNRISTIGYIFKALIKNRKKKYYTDVFVKEIPILSPSLLSLYKNSNNLFNINYKSNKIMNSIFNLNSAQNIEIFISYLVSKLTELNYSPNFCKLLGCYNIVLDKFTYDISSEEEIVESLNYKYKIFDKDDETFLECYKVPVYLLINEKANWDICFLNKMDIVDYNLILSITFQLFSTIVIMQNIFGIKHNDLHFGNVMIKNTKKLHYYYKYDDIYFKIPTFGFSVKIIDWGRATYNCNEFQGRNTIFDLESEAYGQYIYPKFNQLGKNKIDIIDNKWTDIVMISHSLLIEYNNYIKGDLRKLLIKNITDINKQTLELKEYDWDLYLNITKKKFNIKPNFIFKNKIFKKFIVDSKIISKKNIIYKID